MISGMGSAVKALGSTIENKQLLASLGPPVPFPQGTVLIREGDSDRDCYIVKDGFIEISYDEQLLDIVGSGEIVGEMSVLTGQKRSATVTCATDCLMYHITPERFEDLARRDKKLFSYCMQVMSARLTRMNEVASTIMRGPAPTLQQMQRLLDQKREQLMATQPAEERGTDREADPRIRKPPKPIPRPAAPAPARAKNTERRWD